jgi:hypothetical protein
MTEVVVVIGRPGSIGQAIARRSAPVSTSCWPTSGKPTPTPPPR